MQKIKFMSFNFYRKNINFHTRAKRCQCSNFLEELQKHNKMELFIPNDKVISTADKWNCSLFVDCIIVRNGKTCTAAFVD